MAFAVPKLAQILGYSEDQVFFDRFLGATTLRADAVFASSVESAPWVVVEVKGPLAEKAPQSLWQKWQQQIYAYSLASGRAPAFLLTPRELLIQAEGTELRSDLMAASPAIIRAFWLIFKKPDEPYLSIPAATPHGEVVLDEPIDETFRLSRRQLCEMILKTRAAETAQEKGESLEYLAKSLFDNSVCTRVKYERLLTSSSEIDLVIEIFSAKAPPALSSCGRYILVECRNWARPVGASGVRDFISKLKATSTGIGIIFSANGVTGTDSGADALREIQRIFDTDDIRVVVITDQDLQRFVDGASLAVYLDKMLDSLRFNLR